MSTSLLVVDVGHTRVKFAHCLVDSADRLPRVLETFAVIGEAPIDWGQLRDWFRTAPPQRAVVAGTNAARTRAVVEAWPAELPAPTLITDKGRLPLVIDVDFPDRVGIDRLLNAVAANSIREPLQPVVIVNSGTAITVDVLGKDGAFRGGAILPGIVMEAKSLHDETTTLPHVDPWKLLEYEPEVLGKNTEAAIASGLYWGHLGAVRELVIRYTDLLRPTDGEPLLLLTGGGAVILLPYFVTARYEMSLTLQGLALVAFRV